MIPASTFQEDANIPIEDDDKVPEALIKEYSSGAFRFLLLFGKFLKIENIFDLRCVYCFRNN